MRRLILLAAAMSALGACGDDDGPATPTDAGGDMARPDTGPVDAGGEPDTGSMDTGPSDTGPGPADGGMSDLVARGDYIVNHVAACPDCHTPFNEMGMPDRTKFLAGGPFADLVPEDDAIGMVYARNITQDMETGIGGATDDEIKAAFLNGMAIHGTHHGGSPFLLSIMPYYVLHNMTDEDADAVVAYLRTVPAVSNDVPTRQPLPFPDPTAAATPVPAAMIPHTTLPTTDPMYATAERGRYLAGSIGVCMECHTEHSMDLLNPLMLDGLFAGGEAFPAAAFGLPVPPFPDVIYTRNITPHMNGISGWTPMQVRDALLLGTDIDGQGICPPMPAGPMQAFGGITEEDALAIGVFLTTLAPVASENYPQCVLPSMM